MKSVYAKRQHGAALLAMLVVLALGASWYLVSRLNADSGVAAATRNVRNAEALNRAKLALIGYVATQAAEAGERNPGRLPCPEHAWYIGRAEYPDKEGVAGPSVGVTNPGSGSQDCASIGRLPWITLGLEKLVDATGEPLWYVVGPSWRLTTSTSTLLINSNTPSGDITVDGQQTVALIIAPGAAMNVQSIAGCTARNQTRSAPSPTMNARDYIECSDFATSPQFVTTASGASFNDQVLRVTTDDVLPAIEAAIARRIESEIVPVLTAYANPTWGTFPFPAPFGDPATSDYRGQAGSYQGLLPFYYHAGSCGGDVRCSTSTTISWNSAPSLSTGSGTGYLPSSPDCYLSGSTPICEGFYYGGSLNISMTDTTTTRIARGLRTFNVANHTGTALAWRYNGSSWDPPVSQAVAVSRSLASDGSARFIAAASLPSVPDWGYYYIQGSRPAISDHPVLSSTDPTTGWFVRNEWYRLLYYAVAQGYAPGGSLSCISGGSESTGCLQVTNLADPTTQRAILALAGRALTSLSQTRPSNALQNYLDSVENQNANKAFVQSAVGRSFNDRFISVSKNP